MCANATSLSARSFMYSETINGGKSFCKEGTSDSDCKAWQDVFGAGSGGHYTQGGVVANDASGNSLVPNKSSCNELVYTLLNHNDFASTFTEQTGCTTYRDTNGSLTTGCEFTTNSSSYFKTFSDGAAGTLVQDVIASWTCSVTASDPVYKQACCNVGSPNLLTGTDPRTGEAFQNEACDPSWCLSDPLGACANAFQECDAISPCHRHYFLSNIPFPSSDLMVNSLTLLPTNSFTPIKGVRCNDWYTETVKQAIQRTTLWTGVTEVTQRVVSVMNTISGFCGDPKYRGQGECSCFNGYLSHAVPWSNADSGDNLEYQYKTRLGETIYQPFIVSQDAVGQIRRYDAYCADPGNPSFSAPLSFSDHGTWVTYSNVCSTTAPYSEIETQSAFPTINPAKSIRSLTNYGDVVNYEPTDGAGDSLLGVIETFPMPLHCWLPACVAEGVPDTAVFRNLWALGVQPCPSICYQVASGDQVSIGGSGAANAHIHDNFVSCDFGYKNSVFPFAYPPACRAMTVDVPANYIGGFTIPFTYGSLDISSTFVTTSLSAVVNSFPMVALVNDTIRTYSITDKIIQKYDPTNTDVQNVFNLSISIDATHVDPFSSVLSQIVVANNTHEFDSILLKVTVWGSASNARGPAFSTGCCDPTFGNACTPIFSEQVGTPLMTLSDGRVLSFFGQPIVPPPSTVRLTTATLFASGARNRILP